MLEKIQTMQEKSMQKSAFKEVTLPTWHDNKRGTPNTFLRSALFSAIKSRDRADMKGVILASQSGIIVTYTGEQLNQEDLSVWECIIHLAKETPLGISCEFTAYQILKTLGMEDAGENYKQLHNVIIRLTACAVQIQHVGQTFFGSLIASGIRDDKTGHYSITLSKDLLKLYGKTEWTAVNWSQRTLLKKKPLALTLHGYYSTHKSPYPVKIETLQSFSGSRNKQKSGFKAKVQKALEELVHINFLTSFSIDADLVSVIKSK